eukprot:TRINITY_DN436_c0_g1_i4.p1 TRINITY_DN436_c0_g1~~TRINITY_DN436_c0_g1_i4.p1  ORF type:complete len:380 (+),score=193.96 TRINITY_DN436_c0_g1_i4:71-1210(+)
MQQYVVQSVRTVPCPTTREEVEEMLLRLREAVGELGRACGSQYDERVVVVRVKTQELAGRCEAMLQELLRRVQELYDTTIPEGKRKEMQRHVENLKETVEKVVAKTREVVGSVSEQTADEVTKRTGELVMVLERWATDIQHTATALSKTHVEPTLITAKEQLSVYSPSSYDKATSAFAVIHNTNLSTTQRITAFVTLLFQAMYCLVMTIMYGKQSEEKPAKETPQESVVDIASSSEEIAQSEPEPTPSHSPVMEEEPKKEEEEVKEEEKEEVKEEVKPASPAREEPKQEVAEEPKEEVKEEATEMKEEAKEPVPEDVEEPVKEEPATNGLQNGATEKAQEPITREAPIVHDDKENIKEAVNGSPQPTPVKPKKSRRNRY